MDLGALKYDWRVLHNYLNRIFCFEYVCVAPLIWTMWLNLKKSTFICTCPGFICRAALWIITNIVALENTLQYFEVHLLLNFLSWSHVPCWDTPYPSRHTWMWRLIAVESARRVAGARGPRQKWSRRCSPTYALELTLNPYSTTQGKTRYLGRCKKTVTDFSWGQASSI
jgi:hypothetical protein